MAINGVLKALIDQFSSFIPGLRLVDGGELLTLTKMVCQARGGIVAYANGGQANATRLGLGFSSVDTVANAADSVMLPLAIPGTSVQVLNNTATAMQVFGQSSNPNNAGAGDTIAIQGSGSYVATGTGVSHAANSLATYTCTKLGQWKRGSIG